MTARLAPVPARVAPGYGPESVPTLASIAPPLPPVPGIPAPSHTVPASGLPTGIADALGRLAAIAEELAALLLGRDDAVCAALLAVLAHQRHILFGLPGGARRCPEVAMLGPLAADPLVGSGPAGGLRRFAWLMTRFTTMEELFGPLSGNDAGDAIAALASDRRASHITPSLAHLHARFGQTLDDLLDSGLLAPDAVLVARGEACWYRWRPGDSVLASVGKLAALLDLICQAVLDGDPRALGEPHAAFRARLVAGRAVGWEHPLRECVRARLREGRFPLLFVGERRSSAAIRLGVRWEDGRLAARTLHAALRFAGFNPAAQVYTNLFADPASGTAVSPFVVAGPVRAQLHAAAALGVPLIALGRRVEAALIRDGLPHRFLIHPAARGAIRRRDRYRSYVAAVLTAVEEAIVGVAR